MLHVLRIVRIAILPTLVGAFASIAEAQTRGTIAGYVRDATGAVVPNARALLLEPDTGAKREAASNNEGFYQFLGLTPGRYSLTVEGNGFKTYAANDLILATDQNLRADAVLQIGQVTERVSVEGAAVNVDTTSSTLAGSIGSRQLVDLPLAGRNVIAFAGLLPGVTQVSASSNSEITNARAGSTMTVNGGRANQSYYTLNGTFFSNPSRNTGLNVPPPDAVQEVRVQTSNLHRGQRTQ